MAGSKITINFKGSDKSKSLVIDEGSTVSVFTVMERCVTREILPANMELGSFYLVFNVSGGTLLKALNGHVQLTKDACGVCCDSDDDEWRAKMICCGHVQCVECMSRFIKMSLKDGQHIFFCMECKGEKKITEWSYRAIRHVVAHGLTEAELTDIDQILNENGLHNETEIAICPQCKCMCQRGDLSNANGQKLTNRVICSLCNANGSKNAAFCWSCSQPWVSYSSSTSCGNIGCDGLSQLERKNRDLDKCGTKNIDDVRDCPDKRACVRCHYLIHHAEKCKHMICPRCGCEFCFVCLKQQLKGKWQCGGAFDICPVAPRQKLESKIKPPSVAPKPLIVPSAVVPDPPIKKQVLATSQARPASARPHPSDTPDMLLLKMMI